MSSLFNKLLKETKMQKHSIISAHNDFEKHALFFQQKIVHINPCTKAYDQCFAVMTKRVSIH